MSLFDIFKNKNNNPNPKDLKKEEHKAVIILQNILKHHYEGKSHLIPNEIDYLTYLLYHLAFRRTDRKVLEPENFNNAINLMKNPSETLGYVGIYNATKEIVVNLSLNKEALRQHKDTAQFNVIILQTLKSLAEGIKRV